jgi:hypothetical protein
MPLPDRSSFLSCCSLPIATAQSQKYLSKAGKKLELAALATKGAYRSFTLLLDSGGVVTVKEVKRTS